MIAHREEHLDLCAASVLGSIDEAVRVVDRAQRAGGAQVEMLFSMGDHSGSSSGTDSRSRIRPCRVHDFTVPSGAPTRVAISDCESPPK